MKKTLLVISALFATQIVAAPQVAVGTITAVNVNANSVVVEMSPNLPSNNDNCSHPYSDHTLILPLDANTKAQFSALLSANVAQKKARILYEGCLATLPKIIRVDLIQ